MLIVKFISIKFTLFICVKNKLIEKVLETTGYLDELSKDKSEEAQDRIDNLKEFISIAIDFAGKSLT